MLARIFRPSKSAMQSGKAKTRDWVLEFEPKDARRSDPLMGWTVTSDTESTQVRLSFDTQDEGHRRRSHPVCRPSRPCPLSPQPTPT